MYRYKVNIEAYYIFMVFWTIENEYFYLLGKVSFLSRQDVMCKNEPRFMSMSNVR